MELFYSTIASNARTIRGSFYVKYNRFLSTSSNYFHTHTNNGIYWKDTSIIKKSRHSIFWILPSCWFNLAYPSLYGMQETKQTRKMVLAKIKWITHTSRHIPLPTKCFLISLHSIWKCSKCGNSARAKNMTYWQKSN